MLIKFVEIKDTKNGSDAEACNFNVLILGEGLAGVPCISAGELKPGEALDHKQHIPTGCYFSSVERYGNGAKNFFVRNHEHQVIGYLIARPEVK